jgi:hypothetical protein
MYVDRNSYRRSLPIQCLTSAVSNYRKCQIPDRLLYQVETQTAYSKVGCNEAVDHEATKNAESKPESSFQEPCFSVRGQESVRNEARYEIGKNQPHSVLEVALEERHLKPQRQPSNRHILASGVRGLQFLNR